MNRILILIILIFIMSATKGQTNRSVNDANGLPVGVHAPMFKAVDSHRSGFSLKEALKKAPVVLIFYRGFWCPVCNKHLGNLQDSLKLIQEKGATVIAVSPEKPEYLQKMAQKTGAEFRLLYDEDYKISDAYDVTFEPTSKELFVYNVVLSAKLKTTHSDKSQRLPIPATYLINQEGKIVWRQFDRNYKNRASVDEILKALDQYTDNGRL